MHDGDHAAALLAEAAREPHDRQLVTDVEARDRLVEQEIAGLALGDRRGNLAEHARKLNPLLIAARKLLVEAARKSGRARSRGARIPGKTLLFPRVFHLLS